MIRGTEIRLGFHAALKQSDKHEAIPMSRKVAYNKLDNYQIRSSLHHGITVHATTRKIKIHNNNKLNLINFAWYISHSVCPIQPM